MEIKTFSIKFGYIYWKNKLFQKKLKNIAVCLPTLHSGFLQPLVFPSLRLCCSVTPHKCCCVIVFFLRFVPHLASYYLLFSSEHDDSSSLALVCVWPKSLCLAHPTPSASQGCQPHADASHRYDMRWACQIASISASRTQTSEVPQCYTACTGLGIFTLLFQLF